MQTDKKDAKQRAGEEGAKTSPAPSFTTDFWVWREWGMLPGARLGFHLRLLLSQELSVLREQGLGLPPQDRRSALIDFRTRILADVLVEPPVMEYNAPQTNEDFIAGKTSETIRAILPDFPDKVMVGGGNTLYVEGSGEGIESDRLYDRAYSYFSRRDKEGRLVFPLLVEDVTNAFWEKATPSPTSPASV